MWQIITAAEQTTFGLLDVVFRWERRCQQLKEQVGRVLDKFSQKMQQTLWKPCGGGSLQTQNPGIAVVSGAWCSYSCETPAVPDHHFQGD